MLWDKSDVAPVRLAAEKRSVALALTTCQDLIDRLSGALDLACIDVISLREADHGAGTIAGEKPDIVLLDERVALDTIKLQAMLGCARATKNLPVLSIRSDARKENAQFSLHTDSNELEIFLKVRALLRRERPAALRGRRHSGSLVLDEPRFKLLRAEKFADLSKSDLCLLGPFFDVQDGEMDRQSLEQLAFDAREPKVSARIVDVPISRMRRRLKAQLGVDPLRSVRGVGYALSKI